MKTLQQVLLGARGQGHWELLPGLCWGLKLRFLGFQLIPPAPAASSPRQPRGPTAGLEPFLICGFDVSPLGLPEPRVPHLKDKGGATCHPSVLPESGLPGARRAGCGAQAAGGGVPASCSVCRLCRGWKVGSQHRARPGAGHRAPGNGQQGHGLAGCKGAEGTSFRRGTFLPLKCIFFSPQM